MKTLLAWLFPYLFAAVCLLCGKAAAKPGDWKPVTPPPDLSGVVTSSIHLNGALISLRGGDMVVLARHLGAIPGQKVIIDGRAYTLAAVERYSVPRLENPRYLGGDISLAALREPVPAHVTRYPLAKAPAGKCVSTHADGTVARGYGRGGPLHWLRGTYGRPFIKGDSGRPVLVFNATLRRWELSGVVSRIMWGEWLHLHPVLST